MMASVTAMLLAAAVPAIVYAPAGTIEGAVENDVAVFRGIPYARPPVGPLRWRAPQPLPRATTARIAREFGPVCMQPDPKGDAGVGAEAQNEDCLTLNIWAPRGTGSRRAVMVWLHGGGYISGSGSALLYDGAALARRGVVVVTLNYRLGRFGFFAHPGLPAGEGANFGLLDQRAAMQWVQANIAAFGGDPRRVTLFGNSAGGEAVLFHMAARGSRGLFSRAIVQSGLGGRDLRSAVAAIEDARAATPIGELRALPASAILAWGTPSVYRGFGPTIDKVIVDETIESSFRAGRQARVPLIIGYNGFEIPPAAIGGTAAALALVGHDAEQRARGVAAYGSIAAYEQRIASDALFRAPALRLARLHARSAPAWSYEFDVVSPAARKRLEGAPHASERAYVFGNLSRLGWPTNTQDAEIADDIGRRWVAFANGAAPDADTAWQSGEAGRLRFTHDGVTGAPRLAPTVARFLEQP